MSKRTAVHVPAGWYADPIQVAETGMATQRRWWDGVQWTHHVEALPTPVSPSVSSATFAAVTAATGASVGSARSAAATHVASSVAASLAPTTVTPGDSARAAKSMPLHTVDPDAGLRSSSSSASTHSAMSVASAANAEAVGYEPFSYGYPRSAPVARSRTHVSGASRPPLVHTASVWLMATMPITQALLAFWVFSALPADSSTWTRVLAIAFPFVLSAALAGQDARQMTSAGHQRTAPWGVALIAPPLYLAIRGLRVMRSTGVAPWPLVVWLILQLIIVGVWFALDPAGVQALLAGLQ